MKIYNKNILVCMCLLCRYYFYQALRLQLGKLGFLLCSQLASPLAAVL